MVQQFVDAALKLALLDFAPSQPFVEIADGGIRGHYPEGEADLVGLPPDQPCKIGTALVRNGQVPLLGQPCPRIDFDAGALSLMLRTTQFAVAPLVVAPRSAMSATPP